MGRLGRRNTRYKTKFMTKCIDQIYEDIQPDKIEKTIQYATEPDENKPGLGQHYCAQCDKYFMTSNIKLVHEKSRPHLRALKRLLVVPHSQTDADFAAGMLPPEIKVRPKIKKVLNLENNDTIQQTTSQTSEMDCYLVT